MSWYTQFEERLGNEFETLTWEQMGGIGIYAAIRKEARKRVFEVKTDNCGTGFLNVFVNKGAAGLRLSLGQSVVIFTSVHLNAMSERLDRRHEDLQSILTSLNNFSVTADTESESHHFFILGDLNYRSSPDPLALEKKEVMKPPKKESNKESKEYKEYEVYERHVQKITKLWTEAMESENLGKQLEAKQKWAELAEWDQLKTAMGNNTLLVGFRENPVEFAPTFKLDKKIDGGYSEKRVPSHTDRILTRSAHGHGRRLEQLDYTSGTEKSSSDHRPVRAMFKLQYAPVLKTGDSSLLTVRVDALEIMSSFFDTAPLCVQGKIIGTKEWQDTYALWSSEGRLEFGDSDKDGMSFEVKRSGPVKRW